MKEPAMIQPWEYVDPITNMRIKISVSPYYSELEIEDRNYHFNRETDTFNGDFFNTPEGILLTR